MFSVNGKTITMTRGDTAKFKVSIFNQDGSSYTPENGDIIRFAVKQNYSELADILINTIIPNDTLILEISPEDTKELNFGSYVYDIQLTRVNGDIDTFINKGTLLITEEVE